MTLLSGLEMIVIVVFLLVVVAVLVLYAAMIRSLFADAPFVPSPRTVSEAMMKLAGVRPGELIIDLGSGHGEILLAAARSGARACGYELSWVLVAITNLRQLWNARGRSIEVLRRDLFKADLHDADVVTCYIFPKAMERLRIKFEAELKPGARVVSAAFPIHGWTPAQVIHIANRPIFLYHFREQAKQI